jgi:hypothetical protein
MLDVKNVEIQDITVIISICAKLNLSTLMGNAYGNTLQFRINLIRGKGVLVFMLNSYILVLKLNIKKSLTTFAEMINDPNVSFSKFLTYFPEIELPIELTEEIIIVFNKENKALPQSILEQHIYPLEPGELDDLTEFVPCFSISETHEFHAIVYWKASLLRHEYILCCFSKKGDLIARKSIAGMISDGTKITKSVAQIDPELIITIVVGESRDAGITFDPQESQPMSMEILSTGDIIFSLQDKDF